MRTTPDIRVPGLIDGGLALPVEPSRSVDELSSVSGSALVMPAARKGSIVWFCAQLSIAAPAAVSDPEIEAELAWTDKFNPGVDPRDDMGAGQGLRGVLTVEELLVELARADRPLSELQELISYAELVEVSEPGLRAELADALITHARVLRDMNDTAADPPLWAALRRFASLAAPQRVEELLDFMRLEDPATTRQAALLGVHSIVELHALPEGAAADRLRMRVATLARKYLDLDWLTSGQNVALATTAFTAAVLAEVPDSGELVEQALGLKRERLLRRAHAILAEAQSVRIERGLPVSVGILSAINRLCVAGVKAVS